MFVVGVVDVTQGCQGLHLGSFHSGLQVLPIICLSVEGVSSGESPR